MSLYSLHLFLLAFSLLSSWEAIELGYAHNWITSSSVLQTFNNANILASYIATSSDVHESPKGHLYVMNIEGFSTIIPPTLQARGPGGLHYEISLRVSCCCCCMMLLRMWAVVGTAKGIMMLHNFHDSLCAVPSEMYRNNDVIISTHRRCLSSLLRSLPNRKVCV